jgi:hypothetical protein
MTKLNNFVGQSLLAFLPALLIAFVSHFSLSLSGKLSLSFALVGVVFSIAYMGQRAYVAINGVVANSFYNEYHFRNINIVLAFVITLVLSRYLMLPLWLSLCAIAIKLSESPIELNNGIELKYKGARRAAKNLCLASVVRALLVIAPFLVLMPMEESFFKYYSGYYFILGFVVWSFYKRKIMNFNENKNKVNIGFLANFNRLKIFAFATIACSLLSALPRLLISPNGEINNIVLIALSISPALAVIFQALWLANIEKLNTKSLTNLLIFYVEVLAVVVLVILTSVIWEKLIPIFYGISTGVEIDVFKNIILVTSLFFSAMTLMNCFKFYLPKVETYAYVSSSIMMIITYYLNMEILDSILFSSLTMFLFAFLLPIIHLKNELNS